jgi:hypothetical protein
MDGHAYLTAFGTLEACDLKRVASIFDDIRLRVSRYTSTEHSEVRMAGLCKPG